MVRVLSFDCANRSLAVCYASIDKSNHTQLLDCIKKGKDTAEIYLQYAKIHFIKVYDITQGKKLDTVQRTILLKTTLDELDKDIEVANKAICDGKNMGGENVGNVIYDQVLIEYQMSANDKSRCVSQQLLYHYCGKAKLKLVGPTLKNKIDLSSDGSLSHGTFMAKYTTKYTANKNHSKENFKHYLKKTNNIELIKNIKSKNIDDVADAFNQIIGFLNKWD